MTKVESPYTDFSRLKTASKGSIVSTPIGPYQGAVYGEVLGPAY